MGLRLGWSCVRHGCWRRQHWAEPWDAVAWLWHHWCCTADQLLRALFLHVLVGELVWCAQQHHRLGCCCQPSHHRSRIDRAKSCGDVDGLCSFACYNGSHGDRACSLRPSVVAEEQKGVLSRFLFSFLASQPCQHQVACFGFSCNAASCCVLADCAEAPKACSWCGS